MSEKSRSDQNQAFLDHMYLDGGNAAYLEQMLARYMENPSSVDASWQSYFSSLGEDPRNAKKNADGPVWKRPDWPAEPNGELTSALTMDWPDEPKVAEKVKGKMSGASEEDIRRATKDSLRALMLIRAYRIRGHKNSRFGPTWP